MPGVHAVVTGADLTGAIPYYGPAFRDRPILAIDVVRYEGEPVAAVVADGRGRRRAEALELIDVRLRAAPRRHHDRGGAGARRPARPHGRAAGRPLRRSVDASSPSPAPTSATSSTSSAGDGAAALRRGRPGARGHVTASRACSTTRWSPTPPSPRGTRTGGLTVWASTQNPYSVRVELAKMFGVPLAPDPHRRAAPRRGLRQQDLREARAARGACWRAPPAGRCGWRRRPRKRFQHRAPLRRPRARARRLRARRRAAGPSSATPTSTWAPTPTSGRASSRRAPTRPPARTACRTSRSTPRAVYTNTTPGGAFRGFGVPQLAWALESLLDVAAEPAGPRSRRSAAAEPPRPRRGVRAGRHADRRQVRGEPEPRRGGHSLDAGGRRRSRPRRRHDAEGLDRARACRRRSCACTPTAASTVLASTVEMGQGARTVARPDRRRGPGRAARARRRGAARHRHHALRPDDQLEPLDHHDGPRGAGGRRRTCATSSCASPPSSSASRRRELDARRRPRRGSRARRVAYPEVLALRFGMSGGELIGRGVVAPGRTPRAARRQHAVLGDGGRARPRCSVDEETGAVARRATTSRWPTSAAASIR